MPRASTRRTSSASSTPDTSPAVQVCLRLPPSAGGGLFRPLYHRLWKGLVRVSRVARAASSVSANASRPLNHFLVSCGRRVVSPLSPYRSHAVLYITAFRPQRPSLRHQWSTHRLHRLHVSSSLMGMRSSTGRFLRLSRGRSRRARARTRLLRGESRTSYSDSRRTIGQTISAG